MRPRRLGADPSPRCSTSSGRSHISVVSAVRHDTMPVIVSYPDELDTSASFLSHRFPAGSAAGRGRLVCLAKASCGDEAGKEGVSKRGRQPVIRARRTEEAAWKASFLRCYWLTSATSRIQATSARHLVDHPNILCIASVSPSQAVGWAGRESCGTQSYS